MKHKTGIFHSDVSHYHIANLSAISVQALYKVIAQFEVKHMFLYDVKYSVKSVLNDGTCTCF